MGKIAGVIDRLRKDLYDVDSYLDRSRGDVVASTQVKGLVNLTEKSLRRASEAEAGCIKLRPYIDILARYNKRGIQYLPQDAPPVLRNTAEKFGGDVMRTYERLKLEYDLLYQTVDTQLVYLKTSRTRLSQLLPESKMKGNLLYNLDLVTGSLVKSHQKHRLGAITVVLGAVGLGSLLWIWNSLQQQPTTSLAIATLPTFSYFNILFSILILAGLVYGFRHLEK